MATSNYVVPLRPENLPAGITRTERVDSDCFQGPTDDLLALGIVRADQLPGLPGHGKTAVTFSYGQAMGRWQKSKCDEGYLNVRLSGSFLWVTVGLPESTRAEREQAEHERRLAQSKGERLKYENHWWGE